MSHRNTHTTDEIVLALTEYAEDIVFGLLEDEDEDGEGVLGDINILELNGELSIHAQMPEEFHGILIGKSGETSKGICEVLKSKARKLGWNGSVRFQVDDSANTAHSVRAS